MKKTLYQILDVDQHASADEIASACAKRRTALETASASGDSNLPMLLREACETLSDPKRRRAYDESLAMPGPASRRLAERNSSRPSWPMWVVGAALLIAVGSWWLQRPARPPGANAPQAVTKPEQRETKAAKDANSEQVEPAKDEAPVEAPTRPAVATIAAPRTAEEIFAEVAPSIARIHVMDASGRTVAMGSGVVVGNEALVTACHVARRGPKLAAKFGNAIMPATIDVADEVLDLCRLSVPGLQATAVAIGSVSTLRPGQSVYAIGSPAGLELTISQGLVSALRKVNEGTVIQTTTPISQGSSGGGLFDTSGRLVGITTFQHRYGQNLNFALPADWIAQMRAREGPLESVARQALSIGQPQENQQTNLIVGQWLCRDWISGQSGQYRFASDGNLSIALADGRAVSLNYKLSGKALLLSDAKYGASLVIQELTDRKMVIHGRDRSVACER